MGTETWLEGDGQRDSHFLVPPLVWLKNFCKLGALLSTLLEGQTDPFRLQVPYVSRLGTGRGKKWTLKPVTFKELIPKPDIRQTTN